MSESALIVVVPEAEPWVREVRGRYDPVASNGMPAHVTVLVPFIPPEQIGDAELDALKALFRLFAPFEFSLREVRRFPRTTYLAPFPSEPFVKLTKRVVAEFPGYPPYGGRFARVLPHLTVADGDASHAADAESALTEIIATMGPIRASCGHVALYENTTGRWAQVATFPLAGGAA